MSKLAGGWKRYMVVGCSHGHLQDDDAIKQVLKFKKHFKPHRVIHAGDYLDTAAFRSGARGTKDEVVALGPDMGHGLNFLRALEPTDVINGNHDMRLWDNADHHNAIISELSLRMISDIRVVVKKLKASFMEHRDINRSWLQLGDTKVLHGFMYSEAAVKEHAEHFGKCIFAHLHRTGYEQGRRCDSPYATCIGFLGDRDKFTYAHARRSTAKWNLGFGYGEYREDQMGGGQCEINVSRCDCGNALNWRLPV